MDELKKIVELREWLKKYNTIFSKKIQLQLNKIQLECEKEIEEAKKNFHKETKGLYGTKKEGLVSKIVSLKKENEHIKKLLIDYKKKLGLYQIQIEKMGK